jgi:hypothetical protein
VADIPSTSTVPVALPLGTASQPSRSVSSAHIAASPGASTDTATPPFSAETATSTPSPRSAPFGFTYTYDQSLHRMELEARDPVSGFIVYQMPPKYVIKQFSASVDAAIAPARGASVDNAV